MKETIYKSCSLSIKDKDLSKGIVQFYASTFGTSPKDMDSDGDIVMPGAFSKTLKENKGRLKHLYNHWKTIGTVKEAVEDEKGLLITSQLAKDKAGNFSSAANDARIEYEAGVITEHSMGFRIVKSDFMEDPDNENVKCQAIKEIRLWEVSSLDKWGANANTPTVGMKSLNQSNVKSLIDELDALNKAIVKKSRYSEQEIIKLLNRATRIKRHLKSLQGKAKPGKTTSVKSEPISSIDYNFLLDNLKKP